jgi:D-aminoacyl-tRNA deacylase
MRALIQRVTRAQISPSEASTKTIASIGKGMLILVGFEESDSPVSIDQMVQKIKSLRIFSDSSGKMNLAGSEVQAEYLVVSQFTLYAVCKYGNRPSFDKAAPKLKAAELYQNCVSTFQRLMGTDLVKSGVFGSDLAIELINDGPVTLLLDNRDLA